MDFRNTTTALWSRILSLVSLLMGLSDAARLLGFGGGTTSPIAAMGVSGFFLLSLLCVTRLFAAVGLWIQVRWGAMLLLASLAVELILHIVGGTGISLTLWGFIFKLAIMLATIAFFALTQLSMQRSLAD